LLSYNPRLNLHKRAVPAQRLVIIKDEKDEENEPLILTVDDDDSDDYSSSRLSDEMKLCLCPCSIKMSMSTKLHSVPRSVNAVDSCHKLNRKLMSLTCSDRSRVPHRCRVLDTGPGSK